MITTLEKYISLKEDMCREIMSEIGSEEKTIETCYYNSAEVGDMVEYHQEQTFIHSLFTENNSLMVLVSDPDDLEVKDTYPLCDWSLDMIYALYEKIVPKKINYSKIVAATYAPITKEWSLTDANGIRESGVFTPDENEAAKYHHPNEEEWYHTLDLDNEIELVVSPRSLEKRTTENCKERYIDADWYIHIQHFGGMKRVKDLSDEEVTIIL